MNPTIDYKVIPKGTPELQRLQGFAKSFDHTIIECPATNNYAFYKGEICFGYADFVYHPVIYPAFHPGLTNPRDVYRVMNDFKAHCQFVGKKSVIGVPLKGERINFTDDVMNRLGLTSTRREIYTY